MNHIKRITAILISVIMCVSCMYVSAYAAPTVTGIKIVSLPNKTNFFYGDDWQYGVWRFPEEETIGTFESKENIISFMKGNGKSCHYMERGLLDMDGLVLQISYSNETTSVLSYQAIDKGNYYAENIYFGINNDFTAPGKYELEVYLPDYPQYYDTYTINILPYSQGDINNDGKVNANDSLLALKTAVGYTVIPADKTIYADMNGDSVINSIDALMILRKSVR